MLGHNIDVGVGTEAVVLAHLEVVGGPAEERADGERDVGKAADALAPASLLLERDGDDGEEEEDDGPAKGDPQAESKHDGLGDEHADGFDGRGFQHRLQVRCVDVVFGHVALVAGSLPQLFGALVESNSAAGLREEDEDGDEEGHVGDALDAFDPAPAEALVDEACVDGSGDGTEDGDETEHGHGTASCVGLVHVVKGATYKNCTDASEQPKEEPEPDDGADILGER